jgi:hypothetical protein
MARIAGVMVLRFPYFDNKVNSMLPLNTFKPDDIIQREIAYVRTLVFHYAFN